MNTKVKTKRKGRINIVPIPGNKYAGGGNWDDYQYDQSQSTQLINDNNNPVNSIGNIQSAANSLDQYNAAKKAAETGAQGVASGATGASSAVGNLGKAAGVAGGAISIGTDMASMLKVPDVQLANMQASSKGEMSSKINNFKGYDLGRVNVGKAALTGAAKGAAAGATFGPWGAAIGGVIGGLGSAVAGLFGNKKRKKKEAAARAKTAANISSSLANVNQMDLQNTVASQFAEGGPIPPPINSNGFDINAGISERDLKIAGRGRSFFFKKTTDRVGNTRSANALNYQQGNMYNSMTTQYDKGGKIKKHKPQIVW